MVCTHNQKPTWWNCWWKHLLHLLGVNDQRQSPWPVTACMAIDLEGNILIHLLLPACSSLLIPPQNTCTWSSLFLHLLACYSVFLVFSLAILCGGMLINPSLLDQPLGCFLVTSSILWPLSHVQKLPREGQLLHAICLPGDRSSSVYPDYLCDSENWWRGNGNDCIKRIWDLCQIFYGEVALRPVRKQPGRVQRLYTPPTQL